MDDVIILWRSVLACGDDNDYDYLYCASTSSRTVLSYLLQSLDSHYN